MTVFVDTSALYALLDEDDLGHAPAVRALGQLRGQQLITHYFVVVETSALMGRRLGWQAVERLLDVFLPLLETHAVEQPTYESALATFRASGSSRISLVDRTSFEFMRRNHIERAFAFDADFEREGFRLVDQMTPAERSLEIESGS